MRKIYLLTILCFSIQILSAQSIGINTNSPHPSAQLDISSTSKGMLIPRMTLSERNAISAPANGLLVYQTDNTAGFYYNAGSAAAPLWQAIAGNGGFALPYSGAGIAPQLFKVSNTANGTAILAHSEAGTAISAIAYGYGRGLNATTDKGFGVQAISNDTGIAIFGMSQRGNAAKFEVQYTNSDAPVVHVKSAGNGVGLKLEINKPYVNAPGIDLKHSGVGVGIKVHSLNHKAIEAQNDNLQFPTISALNASGDAIGGYSSGIQGIGIFGRNSANGYGIYGMVDGDGIAVLGKAGYTGSTHAVAGRFENREDDNKSDVLQVVTGNAVNNIAAFYKNDTKVARIDHSGKGFFNGGTQNSGADIAEAFDVEGSFQNYEAGDVLVISTSADRRVEKSAQPYSSLVAGVYATKPGVLLTEENMNSDISDKIPMGVVGVIPTKVCIEEGSIKRGDLLVTSSVPGVAMKANPAKLGHGQIIGKALEDFDQKAIGKIKVLVSIR